MNKNISLVLFIIVILESTYIVNFLNKDRAKKTTIKGSSITTANTLEVKKAVELSLKNQVIVDKISPANNSLSFYKVSTQRQNFWVDSNTGLIFMGTILDPKTNINLNSGEEFIIVDGFVHPSKSIGLKLGVHENRGMIQNDERLEKEKAHKEPAREGL